MNAEFKQVVYLIFLEETYFKGMLVIQSGD